MKASKQEAYSLPDQAKSYLKQVNCIISNAEAKAKVNSEEGQHYGHEKIYVHLYICPSS